jgi:hypothetical protein
METNYWFAGWLHGTASSTGKSLQDPLQNISETHFHFAIYSV